MTEGRTTEPPALTEAVLTDIAARCVASAEAGTIVFGPELVMRLVAEVRRLRALVSAASPPDDDAYRDRCIADGERHITATHEADMFDPGSDWGRVPAPAARKIRNA